MSNSYRELRERQQQEMNAMPLGFAFSNKQFEEMMQKWGLDPEKDVDKLVRIPAGGFIQKKDAQTLTELVERHDRELQAAIEMDLTGEEFIYEMFYYEMANHEYGYTGDPEDTLNSLGLTFEDVANDPRLLAGFKKAEAEIMSHDCF